MLSTNASDFFPLKKNPSKSDEKQGLFRGERDLQPRVARFFLTQFTETRENIPNYHNITKCP
jgi:hypothetical protein